MTGTIAIAGGGPVGLAAAAAAARAGASVLVLEERSQPGGQLRYRVQPAIAEPGEHARRPHELADRLLDDALTAGAEVRTGALVAASFPGNELLVVEGDHAWRLQADTLIVTTGSTDLPYPFAGATFPGVFSARGLQILFHQHRVRPGHRFAIVGGGAEAEELAVDIMLAGGEVVWSGIAPAPFLAADGPLGVRALTVGQEHYEVDVIATAVGRQADAALAAMAGTALAFSADLGGLVPVLDDRLRSLENGIFVAGDAAGAGSISAAIAEGRLAGVAAAATLGLASEAEVMAARAAGGPELAWRISVRASLHPRFVQPFE